MSSKTAIIFDSCGEEPMKFYITDQQVHYFNDFYINSTKTPEVVHTKMVEFFYNDDGQERQTAVTREEFVAALKEGAELVVCGMIP